jgi:sialic acid synthase SpsE
MINSNYNIKLIAEIGWNHGGDMELAKDMITAAAAAGADYAKFQTWSVDRLKNGPWDSDGRRAIYEKAELSVDDHKLLIEHCAAVGVKFLSSVFSLQDAKLLFELGCREVKIPSFESRNHQLLKYCNETFDTVFMSTGTSTASEVLDSKAIFKKATLYLLHCVSTYPGTYEKANLPKMHFLQSIHDLVGYSDHIEGIESAKVAVAQGAMVIEKHFTVDRNLPGRDNKFAILPQELLALSKFISYYNNMMINHGNDFQQEEQEARQKYTGRFDG